MKRTLLILALLVLMLAGCNKQGRTKAFYVEANRCGGGYVVFADRHFELDTWAEGPMSCAEADSVCRELNKRLEGE